MNGFLLLKLVPVVLLVFLAYALLFFKNPDEKFTQKDKETGVKALQELMKNLDEVEDISDEELNKMLEDIHLVVTPEENSRENLSYFHPVNTRYWPFYYYSFPYNYKYGGAWPPGMYSRLYYWSPGFYTGSGLSYYMRPGIGYKWWPRNRWIRNQGSYYYVTNRSDYTHNAADYGNTPLIWG